MVNNAAQMWRTKDASNNIEKPKEAEARNKTNGASEKALLGLNCIFWSVILYVTLYPKELCTYVTNKVTDHFFPEHLKCK